MAWLAIERATSAGTQPELVLDDLVPDLPKAPTSARITDTQAPASQTPPTIRQKSQQLSKTPSAFPLGSYDMRVRPATPADSATALMQTYPSQQSPFERETGPAFPDQSNGTLPLSLQGQSNSVLEVPQVYLGCWQAMITQPDSWQHFSGPHLGNWVPTKETVCFQRNSHGVEITFHRAELDEAVNEGRIFNRQSKVFVTGSAGNRITLRSFGSALERARIFGIFNRSHITITWSTDAPCDILPDQQTIIIDVSEKQSCSGSRM